MVTGRRPFAGDSVTETLGAVLHLEPKAPSELAPGMPKELDRLIRRCLKKDPARRIQHMADVKVELMELEEESKTQPAASAARSPNTRRRTQVVAGSTALVALGALIWALFMWSSPLGPVRLVPVTTGAGNETMPSLSPDGESVAFSWEGESHPTGAEPDRDIWITLIGASENRRLTSGPTTTGRQIGRRMVSKSHSCVLHRGPLSGQRASGLSRRWEGRHVSSVHSSQYSRNSPGPRTVAGLPRLAIASATMPLREAQFN